METAEKAVPEIARYITNTREEVEILRKSLERLLARLEPVLRAETPENKKGGDEKLDPAEPKTDIGRHVKEIGDSIALTTEGVDQIIKRLEI